jgi:hypothetical protein
MSVRFSDRLRSSLTVTVGQTAHEIPGGAIKVIELDATMHGFHGHIEFLLLDDASVGGGWTDELAASFVGQDLAQLELELAAVWDEAEASSSPDPITVKGLVTDRWVEELLLRNSTDMPILARRYHMRFADPAAVLWTQHYPCRLYTNATLQSAIEEQLGDQITLSVDWSVLTTSAPLWFLHLPPAHGASFWDFVVWFTDQHGGYFTYDYAASGYTLKAARDGAGTAASMFGDDIARMRLHIADIPRYSVDVCNSYAESPTTSSISQAQAQTAIRHDLMMRSTISANAEARVTVETARLKVPMCEATLEFGRMPIVALMPGGLLTLPASNRWNSDSIFVDKTWRVRELHVRARAPEGPIDQDVEIDDTQYEIELGLRLMQSDDGRPVLPGYRVPEYPGFIEGKVVSSLGEDGEKTYENNRNDDTSIDEYTVKIPLWEDQEIKAPFVPLLGSGNVYLPCYREERVLMAIDLDHASIAQLLVWRDGVALAKDVQGEQILWGKSETSNTSVNHVYEDDAPVFNVARTHAADTAVIKLSEGTLLMRVEETQET